MTKHRVFSHIKFKLVEKRAADRSKPAATLYEKLCISLTIPKVVWLSCYFTSLADN